MLEPHHGEVHQSLNLVYLQDTSSTAIIRLGLSFPYHAQGPWPLISTSQEVLVPSLGHPHLPCFLCFYGACGSLVSRSLSPFLTLLMLLHCWTLPLIHTHQRPSCKPGRHPPHDMSIDVKVNQRTPDVIRNIVNAHRGNANEFDNCCRQ